MNIPASGSPCQSPRLSFARPAPSSRAPSGVRFPHPTQAEKVTMTPSPGAAALVSGGEAGCAAPASSVGVVMGVGDGVAVGVAVAGFGVAVGFVVAVAVAGFGVFVAVSVVAEAALVVAVIVPLAVVAVVVAVPSVLKGAEP